MSASSLSQGRLWVGCVNSPDGEAAIQRDSWLDSSRLEKWAFSNVFANLKSPDLRDSAALSGWEPLETLVAPMLAISI